MTFNELNIAEPILRAIAEKGYTHPTPIQEKAIPVLLRGEDLLGCAQTGTGKTAAFAIPIIQQLYLDEFRVKTHRNIKALVVTPTRELAIQIQENFNRITFVGSICHFVADITTYDSRNYGNYPYGGYYDPYYSPYGYSPYGSYYSPYGYGMPYRQQQTSRNELKQYLIDFETGKVIDYEPKNVKILIMKDAELYEEYVKLSRKKQKQLMFVYIRKFNEKNPLYLPSK
jgi:hypothetical protein